MLGRVVPFLHRGSYLHTFSGCAFLFVVSVFRYFFFVSLLPFLQSAAATFRIKNSGKRHVLLVFDRLMYTRRVSP